jgi:hypothetical protein
VSLVKRRITLLLLLAFVAGELFFHRAGLVQPVLGPAKGGAWTELAPGAYRAVDGHLVPEQGTGPVLTVAADGVHPAVAVSTVAVDAADAVLLFDAGRFAVVREGNGYTLPVKSRDAYVFADGSGRNLWAVTPGRGGAVALLPEIVGGVGRAELEAQHPGWRILWALAPTPLPDGTILYVSNRSAPDSDVLSLWAHRTGGDQLILDGAPLRSVWPLGVAGGRAYLADGRGDVVALTIGRPSMAVLATEVEPVAFSAEDGALVSALTGGGGLAVVGAGGRVPVPVPPSARFLGFAAFAPDGRHLALVARVAGRAVLLVFERRAGRYLYAGSVSPPPGETIEVSAAPSWLDARRMVVPLSAGTRLSTYAYVLPGSW